MKIKSFKRQALTVMSLALPLMLGACGSKNSTDNGSVPPGTNYPVPLPPGNYPIPPISGGCQPITGPITFTVQNGYADWANIVGGRMPRSGQQVGQTYMGSGGNGPYSRSGSDGQISMNITPVSNFNGAYPYNGFNSGCTTYGYGNPYCSGGNYNYGTYGYGSSSLQGPTQATISGVIQLSPLVISDIQYQFGGGYYNTWGGYNPYSSYNLPGSFPYNNMYPGSFPTNATPLASSNICVSSVALDLGHYYNTIYGGNVYLYLNGTQHGYVLYF